MNTPRPVTTGVLTPGFWWSQSDDKSNTASYARLDLGHRRHGMAGVESATTKATSSRALASSRPQPRAGEAKEHYLQRLLVWDLKMQPSNSMWRRYRDIGHSARTAQRWQHRLAKRAAQS